MQINEFTIENLTTILAPLNGTTFGGIETLAVEPLTGGQKNPMQGKITKRTVGTVQFFSNMDAYGRIVNRRLADEGKADDFTPEPRRWGTRVDGTPFLTHTPVKTGEYTEYLEVYFLNVKSTEYFLDGKPINKEDVIGIKPSARAKMGGLSDEAQPFLRDFKVKNIKVLRIFGNEYKVAE